MCASSEPPEEWLFYVEFTRRREGMIHAMDGGLWLHRHVWKGRAMAHLVSTDRERLLAYGRAAGLAEERLQFKPLKDPRTAERRAAWHWDLVGRFLPPRSGVHPSAELTIESSGLGPDVARSLPQGGAEVGVTA